MGTILKQRGGQNSLYSIGVRTMLGKQNCWDTAESLLCVPSNHGTVPDNEESYCVGCKIRSKCCGSSGMNI
jgi:hypothetical protein